MKTLIIYDSLVDGGSLNKSLDQAAEIFNESDNYLEVYHYTSDKFLADKIALIKKRKYKRIALIARKRIVNRTISLLRENGIDIPLAIFVGSKGHRHIYFNRRQLISELYNFTHVEQYQPVQLSFVNDRYFQKSVQIGYLMDADSIIDRTKRNLSAIANNIIRMRQIVEEKTFNLDLRGDVEKFSGKALYLEIQPISAGAENLFVVTLVKSCPSVEALYIMRALRSGEKINNSHLLQFTTKQLYINSNTKTKISYDGESIIDFPMEFIFATQPMYLQQLSLLSDGIMFSERLNAVLYDFGHLGFVNYVRKNILVDLLLTLADIPRHNPFVYRNRDSLATDYFIKARETLNDGYIYLILSSTGTPASEVASFHTKRTHAHISLSFDPQLETIISYNGGGHINRPGLNPEKISYFFQKPDANMIIYKLPVTREQKEFILEEVRRINEEGSSYNYIGWQATGRRENIMFCSQFIYLLLEKAGIGYFSKNPARIRPTDFVELDYSRKLIYCSSFYLQDLLNNSYLLEDSDYLREDEYNTIANGMIDFRRVR